MKSTEIEQVFEKTFGHPPKVLVYAPGRVNLIGEHTDYNQGFILPVAIDRYIVLAAAPREDWQVLARSQSLNDQAGFNLKDLGTKAGQWSDYLKGVAWALEEARHSLKGMEALIGGDLPRGSGLSSSAALEVAVAQAFVELNHLQISPKDLALLCQRAENQFVGLECGIMDQFCTTFGKEGRAILIDCRNLELEWVSIPSGVCIIVTDSRKRRGLLGSEYNKRREECREGAHLLGVKSLREVESLDRIGQLPPIIKRRVRHVVSENRRVHLAATALREADLSTFGDLMYESHRSLAEDYQVSCRELDTLVEIASKVEGVYGSRLTGAGFGGCTVSLVAEEAILEFQRKVSEEYTAATGMRPEVFICRAADGARAHLLD